MAVNLSQKEKMLLNDQKNHEQVCIQKYQNYAAQTQDPQLKQLFQSYAQQEQQHLNTINQILSGQVPSMNQGQQQGQQQATSSTQSQQSQQQTTSSTQSQAATSSAAGSTASTQDAALCNDMLMTEKYVSGAYDTAIFEFTDSDVRQALNHIQKEEQEHGQGIFNYMRSHGMYNINQ